MLRIDPDTFKLVEKWADDKFRSVNGQLEWMIQKSLKEAKRWKKPKSEKPDSEEKV